MTDDQMLLAERYRLGERLGRGGMAEVRRGFDLRLERSVAVKRLKVELAADPSFQERFRREAHAAASLNHPGIAAIYDTGAQVDPDTGVPVPFLVLELVDGPTLRDVLREKGALPVDDALELTRVVLAALGHSHAAGIIHRDVKPSNIMLTPRGDAKVMDFGIARAAAETSSGLTATATVLGTAHYLSPEQARGERVDQRSDLYSTGCLLYELLLGRPPFLGDSSVSVVYQHVREMPTPPSEVDARLGPDIDALIAKALAKDPADRYQSADEMVADIDRVLAGRPVQAGPPERDQDTHLTAVVPPPVASPPTPVDADVTDGTAGRAVVGPPPGDEPDHSRRGVRGLLIALLVLLVLAGLTFGAYRLLRPEDASQVRVPSVIGRDRPAAEQGLRDADLRPAFRNVDGPADDTVGTVIRQDPPPETEVDADTVVTAEINVGPATERVPDDLVGQDVDDVVETLRDAGFSNVIAAPDPNPPAGADPDEVTAVEPGEGEKAAPEEDILVSYVGQASRAPTSGPRARPSGGSSRGPSATKSSTRSEEASDEPSESEEPSDDPTSEEPSAEPSESEEPEPEPSGSDEPSASESSGGGPSGEPSVGPSVSVDPAEISEPPQVDLP